MSLCVSCGLQLLGDAELCAHHQYVNTADWATGNRIMCDFFHRKKLPRRLAPAQREDETWPSTREAA